MLVAAGLAAILVEAESAPAAPGDAGAAADASGTLEATSEPESAPAAPDGADPARDEEEATEAGEARPLAQRAQRRKRATRPRIERAGASPRKIFLGGPRRAKFRFRWDGLRTRKLLVKVVKVSNGNIRKRIRLGKVEPGERKRVAWNGKIRRKGAWLAQGRHAFRVFANGERARVRKRNSTHQRFRFFRHRFPVQGRHTYGDGLGAGRGHQGQDLFGRCGSKIRAARGGRVQTRAYQSSAGYYVVIDGRGTGRDYVYMHLRRKQRPKEGSWVKTGQVIGRMGATGNASGCHLHFELWSAPGWYEGGRPLAPTKPLRRWDRWS